MHWKSENFNFKLLVTLPNDTEAGKIVSVTESLLLLKSQTLSSTNDLTIYFGQCISTKRDPFVRSNLLLIAY